MFKKHILTGLVLAAALMPTLADDATTAKPPAPKTDEKTGSAPLEDKNNVLPPWNSFDRWSFQGGVAFITESTIDDILVGDGERARGADEGEIYLLQASYKLAAFEPHIGKYRPQIDLELPFVLGIANEHERDDLWLQYNLGLTVRWKSFPWNKWLYTNLETGCGLTYSQYVIATERVRHPDRDRSHLEIYWPVQLMFALPKYREHQLSLFLHHHSGGGMFHTGGANSLGLGYRYVPGER
jgi:hypothetical protein